MINSLLLLLLIPLLSGDSMEKVDFDVTVNHSQGTSTSIDNIQIPPNQIEWMSREWIHADVPEPKELQLVVPTPTSGMVVEFGWEEKGPWNPTLEFPVSPETPTVAFWMRTTNVDLEISTETVPLQVIVQPVP